MYDFCMFRPLGDRVLVQVEEKNETSFGLIMATDDSKQTLIGLAQTSGKEVAKGDKIVFLKYGSDEIELDKQAYRIVSEKNILGILWTHLNTAPYLIM